MIRIGIIGFSWWGKPIVTSLAHRPQAKVARAAAADGKPIAL